MFSFLQHFQFVLLNRKIWTHFFGVGVGTRELIDLQIFQSWSWAMTWFIR
jgi:hypothetical protein